MNPRFDHDVLIAGAGPAGTHTALRLARMGWNVGLVDAKTFPRAKPCGEFLSPACLPLLDDLGLLDDVVLAGATAVRGMNFSASGASAHGRFQPMGRFASAHEHGLGIRREVLDLQAVQSAAREPGVTLRLGWRVSGPELDADGRVLGLKVVDPSGARTSLRSRFVVGADGLRSRVVQGMGWSVQSEGPRRFALVARFTGVEACSEAEVHVTGRDYFAACPIDGDRFTANLVVDADDLPAGSENIEGFFRERVERAPRLARLLEDATPDGAIQVCGPLRAERRRSHAPGLALVGDACGFVDPLTGEGLYFAMQGARYAATAIDRALHAPRREARALRGYRRARRRDFAPRYALARLLQRGLRRGGMPERVIGTFERAPGLCNLALALTGDYVPPHGLLSPGVWKSVLHGRATQVSTNAL